MPAEAHNAKPNLAAAERMALLFFIMTSGPTGGPEPAPTDASQ
jgi:hypothetical protein